MFKKESKGQRGKWAEKEVAECLEHFNNKISKFYYERLPDARAAGGRMKATICDFFVWDDNGFYMIEVKTTEHDYRLPVDKAKQLPRIRAVEHACDYAVGLFLIYHSNLCLWRIVESQYMETEGASYDFKLLHCYNTAEEALKVYFKVPK